MHWSQPNKRQHVADQFGISLTTIDERQTRLLKTLMPQAISSSPSIQHLLHIPHRFLDGLYNAYPNLAPPAQRAAVACHQVARWRRRTILIQAGPENVSGLRANSLSGALHVWMLHFAPTHSSSRPSDWPTTRLWNVLSKTCLVAIFLISMTSFSAPSSTCSADAIAISLIQSFIFSRAPPNSLGWTSK
jgi:hypothetical protein